MSRLLHFAPEVGYYVSPDLLLSVQLRFQLITGATDYHSGMNNPPGGAATTTSARRARTRSPASRRASYFFGEGDLRTVRRRHGGLGTIRHVADVRVAARSAAATRRQTCVDTVPSGPVFVGGGRRASCTT